MVKQSAGLLLFRRDARGIEVLLVHPGGPFWAKKDSWSVPKGETDPNEDLLAAANREFEEELGIKPPPGKLVELGSAKQGSKTNHIWALEGDIDLTRFKSNTFSMEWPPSSGQQQDFPEVDRAEWFKLEIAKQKIFKSQTVFIDRLAANLGLKIDEPPEQTALF